MIKYVKTEHIKSVVIEVWSVIKYNEHLHYNFRKIKYNLSSCTIKKCSLITRFAEIIKKCIMTGN